MGYRSRMAGDYRSGYQGGFGLASIGLGLAKRLGGSLVRRFSGRGAASAAASAAAAGIGMAGAGRAVSVMRRQTLPVPLPGGARLNLARLAPGGVPAITPGQCPKGYRLNKSSYFLKNGTFVPEGTKCVKYRRRNFANGRALRRSIGRVKGFESLVKSSRKSLRALAKI